VADDDGPIHIHIAEQTAEVDDCLAATGQRPIEWLARQVPLDARWHLVHATHAQPAEMDAVARAGASIVICPSTEANLGDGLTDLPGWLARHTVQSIGSDSHVSRSWADELRLLEYGQRLALRQRNVAAAPELGIDATAARLFDRSIRRRRSGGFDAWGLCLEPGPTGWHRQPGSGLGVPTPTGSTPWCLPPTRPPSARCG
jgi:formimidoylglutamate deiminase